MLLELEIHYLLKSKNKQVHISEIEDKQGNKLTNYKDIEKKSLNLYTNLVGKVFPTLTHVDISVLRDGTQLNMEQQASLIKPLSIFHFD